MGRELGQQDAYEARINRQSAGIAGSARGQEYNRDQEVFRQAGSGVYGAGTAIGSRYKNQGSNGLV